MSILSNLAKQLWSEYLKKFEEETLTCKKQLAYHRLIPKNVATKTLISIGESLIGYWDSLVKDNWASLDARVMRRTFRSGTIREGFKRTWIAPAPSGSELEIIVKKRIAAKPFPGKLGGTITVEKYDRQGTVIERKSITFSDGKYEATRTIRLDNQRFGFLLVTVDTPVKPGKSFAYSIRYKENIVRKTYGKVKGFADVHTHLAAEYAYAGNWMHGKMMGPQATALSKCTPINHKIHEMATNPIHGAVKLGIIKSINGGAKEDPSASIVKQNFKNGNGFPTFRHWPHHLDIMHQQMHENWVRQAFKGGMKVLFACAVNSEMLNIMLGSYRDNTERWRDMNNLRKQIDKIHDFCERNSNWAEIAYNPWHAREIIAKKKLAIVLAIEASNIFPPDQGDYISQLDDMYCLGVRKVIMVHHVDNRFGGAAPQERQLTTAQTFSAITRASLISNNSIRDNAIFPYLKPGENDKIAGFDYDANGKSKRGLSTSGVRLVNAMMDRNMLIDVSHNSQRTFNDVFNIAERRKYYPLMASHTKFESILSDNDVENVQREFLTTDDQIEKINRTGGFVGLRTAPWTNQKSCCGSITHVQPDDEDEVGTSRNFAQQVAYAYKMNIDFGFGTDMNGYTNQIGPRGDGSKPATVSRDYWNNGLKHIGLLPDVVNDLIALNTPGARLFNQSAEKFLMTWQRCYRANRQEVIKSPRNLPAGRGRIESRTDVRVVRRIRRRR